MRKIYLYRKILIAALICAAGSVGAQVHPLAFGPHTLSGSTSLSNSNWYKDYVGARVVVTAPTSIAGAVTCAVAQIGTGASQWPDIVWTSIVNQPIVMDNTADSFAGTAFPAGSMTGKIAVIWRGPIAPSPFDFGLKALNCQNAGAIACVIINEYPAAAPFVPGYTAHGTPVHIPVIMIGNLDGIAISGVYHSSPANTVKMTLTPWGMGNADDLGIVPKGTALWQYYAVPASQLAAGNAQMPYKGLDGAFVANFGSHKATGTKLISTLSFTPTGGVSSVVHTDSLIFEGDFTGTGTTDTLADSVMAMFPVTYHEYNLAASVPGRYDMTYKVSSDSVDDYLGDNTLTNSFYLTDSLFSRSRYDFVNKRPLSNSYEAYASAAEITWGTFYYMGKGGSYISDLQYSLSNGGTAHPSDLVGSNDIYVFKWVDGSGTTAPDSLVQDGELDLISWTHHPFVSGVDTSTGVINQTLFYDSTQTVPMNVPLDSNTWYYMAIDIPAGSSDTLFLGIDGVGNPFPRIFGRWLETNGRYLDYADFVGTNAVTYTSNPAQAEIPLPFAQVSFVSVVDSFSWNNVIGMIPSIALITTTHPDNHVGVNNLVKSPIDISLFPNPASDYLNVSVVLGQMAKSVTYKIIDGMGRVVAKETHTNILKETYSINTAAMRSGSYFLLISADDMHTSKKFTVVK